MKKHYIVLGVLLCGVVALSGCVTPWTGSQGNANQPPNVQGVTAVSLTGPGTLIVQQGDNESLTVEADNSLKPNIDIIVSGNNLAINNRNSVSNEAVKFHLTVKNLNSLTVTGLGVANATNLNTGSLTATINTGTMSLAGKVSQLTATINGRGTINANDLESQTATVTINGDGRASLNVVQTLNAVINGGGSITYLGNPQVNKQINGLGTVTQGSG